MDNYVGRCVDCINYLDCEEVEYLKASLSDKKFKTAITSPLPCPDYEFAGEANV